VLTNGMNVGGRAGSPSAPGGLAPGAFTLDVQPGQGLRLQILNTATTRFFRLLMTDDSGTQIPIVRVGGTGGLLDKARTEGGVVSGFDFKYTSGEVLVDPGDRVDVVVAIPASATGVLTMWTQDFDRTGNGFADPHRAGHAPQRHGIRRQSRVHDCRRHAVACGDGQPGRSAGTRDRDAAGSEHVYPG
jgi:hypothetical protein